MLQKKYHPIRTFDNRTGETYIEQVGIPMYEEAGFRFDIPNDKLLDRSWHYKPEDWVPNSYRNSYKNRQVTSNNDTNNESEVEDDDYDGESDFDSDKTESEIEEDDYEGETDYDSDKKMNQK